MIPVVGTFTTDVMGEGLYFTFESDGYFYHFRQFELVEKGTYEVDGEVITLKGSGTDKYIIYVNNMLYYFDIEKNNVSSYIRLSNIPTFINLPDR